MTDSGAVQQTWILTGSPENYAATRERGFTLIGMKERRRRQAEQMVPGDRIVLYLTRVKAFGGSLLLTSDMFEDRAKVWPGKPGAADPYPWRFESRPEIVLDEAQWLPGRARGGPARARCQVAGRALDARLPGAAPHGVRARLGAAARGDGGAALHSGRMSFQKRVRELAPELRMAAVAALVLVLSLFLPWYQKSFVPTGKSAFVQDSLSAFGVFTFVEAAVLLVAAGVLFLIWARMEGKGFHLPGGDGLVISLAGGWAMVLLIWRVFDRPGDDGASTEVGIQWGFIVALGAAAALIVAGARVRAAHRPEPPNPAEDLDWEAAEPRPRRRAEDREPRDATAVTEVLRDRPNWEGDAPAAPGERRPKPPTEPQDPDRLF